MYGALVSTPSNPPDLVRLETDARVRSWISWPYTRDDFSAGTLIGAIAIVAVMAAGALAGLYFWFQNALHPTAYCTDGGKQVKIGPGDVCEKLRYGGYDTYTYDDLAEPKTGELILIVVLAVIVALTALLLLPMLAKMLREERNARPPTLDEAIAFVRSYNEERAALVAAAEQSGSEDDRRRVSTLDHVFQQHAAASGIRVTDGRVTVTEAP